MPEGRLGLATWQALGAISLAAAAIGISFGAIAVASGIPGWLAIAMSVFIHAGGSQFLAVGLIAAGNPLAAAFAGLLLNARHLPFGLALGSTLGESRLARLIGSQLISDESVAFAMAQPEGPRRRRAFWACGITLTVAWDGGTAIGVLLGHAVGDPASFGLDTAFPAGLLALVLPALRDRDTRIASAAGAAVAVATTPFLPAGLPILLSVAGLAMLAPSLVTRRSRSGACRSGCAGSAVSRGPRNTGTGKRQPQEREPQKESSS
jgi:predicted branched-subunit amino acid permease